MANLFTDHFLGTGTFDGRLSDSGHSYAQAWLNIGTFDVWGAEVNNGVAYGYTGGNAGGKPVGLTMPTEFAIEFGIDATNVYGGNLYIGAHNLNGSQISTLQGGGHVQVFGTSTSVRVNLKRTDGASQNLYIDRTPGEHVIRVEYRSDETIVKYDGAVIHTQTEAYPIMGAPVPFIAFNSTPQPVTYVKFDDFSDPPPPPPPPPPPVPTPPTNTFFLDTFTGPAGPLSGHMADKGGGWTVHNGYVASEDAALDGFGAVVNTGGTYVEISPNIAPPTADYTFEMDYTIPSDGGMDIFLRGSAFPPNYEGAPVVIMSITGQDFSLWESGSASLDGTIAAAGTLRIVMEGSSIKIINNDTFVGEHFVATAGTGRVDIGLYGTTSGNMNAISRLQMYSGKLTKFWTDNTKTSEVVL